MNKKEKTADIENILETEKGLKKYLDQYNHQNVTEVDTLLYQILENKKIKQSYLIKRSGVSRVYAYEVLRGTKHPGRDTLLRFLIALSLGFEEIQQALKVLSYPHFCMQRIREMQ